jgi:hypothetical protein
MNFVHGFILVHQFRKGILGVSMNSPPPQNPKLNCVLDNHDNTKNRFSRLCSKNGMNAGMIHVAGHYYPFTNDSLRSANPTNGSPISVNCAARSSMSNNPGWRGYFIG